MSPIDVGWRQGRLGPYLPRLSEATILTLAGVLEIFGRFPD
jgi:hypothetical protein